MEGTKLLFGKGKDGIQKAYDDLYKYLTGRGYKTKATYDQSTWRWKLPAAAKDMRNQVDGLTDVFMREIENSWVRSRLLQKSKRCFKKSISLKVNKDNI